MVSPAPVFCVSCRKLVELNDTAVFRDGVRIAHIRCWRPEHSPMRSPHDGLPPVPSSPRA
jgi:hypothetical protein